MTLTERRVGDVTVLDLQGRLVFDEGDAELRDRINELLTQGRRKIVVNLRDVTYIDSCGLGALIAKYVSVRQQGGNVKLLHLSSRSHRVIDISGLQNVFEVFDSEDDAITSFAARQDV